MRCAKTTCNIMLFRFLAEMGPPGSKNGYFGAKCGMQKSHILSKISSKFHHIAQKDTFWVNNSYEKKIGAGLSVLESN